MDNMASTTTTTTAISFDSWRRMALEALQREHDHEAASVARLRLTNLRITARMWGLAGRNLVELASPKTLPYLEPGTPVQLCVANRPVLSTVKGRVEGNDPLIVAVNGPLDAEDSTALWILDELPDETSLKRVRSALEAVDSQSKWPRVLFDQTQKLSSPKEGASPPTWFNAALNSAQQRAVRAALSPSLDLVAIHGPPGTGKSSALVEIIRQLAALGRSVLVCAPSNVAVDNLLLRLSLCKLDCVRLGHLARVDPRVVPWTLDSIVASSDDAKLIADARQELSEAQSKKQFALARDLRKEIKSRERSVVAKSVAQAQVVLSTIVTSSKLAKLIPKDKRFVLVVDEAAQTSLAAAFVPLAFADACIVAGDHKQLAPTVKNPSAAAILSQSLMEAAVEARGSVLLDTQYRMHPRIMQWASSATYQGKLLAGTDDRAVGDDMLGPMVMIDTAGCDMEEQKAGESWVNPAEAQLARAHVRHLISAGVQPSDVAVIAPYSAQVALVRELLDASTDGLAAVQVRTVDGFQGQERRAVVLSLVRSGGKSVGFLADVRRINVAVTRAKQHVAIIGDSELLSRDLFLKTLVDYVLENGEVRSAAEFGVSSNDGETAPTKPATSATVPKEDKAIQQKKTTKPTKPTKPATTALEIVAKPIINNKPPPPVAAPPSSSSSGQRATSAFNAASQIEESAPSSPSAASSSSSSPPPSPSKAPSPPPPLAAPLPQRSSNASKPPKATTASVTAAEDDYRDLAFLEAAAKEARQCSYGQCHEVVAVIGFDCRTCRSRFCSRHRLPETHGCTPSKATTSKPLKPSARRELVAKVESKIAKEQEKRTSKPKKKT